MVLVRMLKTRHSSTAEMTGGCLRNACSSDLGDSGAWKIYILDSIRDKKAHLSSAETQVPLSGLAFQPLDWKYQRTLS